MDQNNIKSLFLPKDKISLAEGQSPTQELEEGPSSRSYLLVLAHSSLIVCPRYVPDMSQVCPCLSYVQDMPRVYP